MATDTRQITFLQTTDAEFRTWVAAVIAQLTAIGLTQTADTGQIDTATVTKAGATNTSQGYAIFRFNDTMQATRPVFLKFEFGSGANVAHPSIWLTVASATDGAGTVSGTTIAARAQISFLGWASPIDNIANYNATLGMFHAHWASRAATGYYATALVARTCDDTETPDDKGLLTAASTGIATPTLYVFADGTTEAMYLYEFPYSPSGNDPVFWTTDGYQVAFACQGYYPTTGGFFTFPGILGIHATHWPSYWEVYATIVSTERKFMCMPQNGTAYGWDADSTTSGKLAWLWE